MAKNSKTQIFRGKTYTEALVKAKSQLGADFSIVTRRDVREGNLFSKLTSGKLGGDCLAVELEVAPMAEPEVAKDKEVGKPGAHPLLRSYAKALEGAEKHGPAARRAMTEAASPFVHLGEAASGISGRLDAFQKELEKSSKENADLREELRMIITLQARGGVPAVTPQLLDCYRLLTKADVDEALARDLVEKLQAEWPGLLDPEDIRRELLRAVARRIPAAGPILPREGKPTVVALLGASGVGKSTSVVKLAIQFAMKAQKSVAVVNEDLRRPGADGQINNLGRLFGIAVATASEPEEMADVIRSMSSRDLILVDTGGRSPRDAKGIDRLAAIVRAAGADETHLLLSCVSSARTMRETALRYKPTGYDRIMLTKLDECVSYGDVLNVGAELAEGIGYITTGPDYTKPIEPADSVALAEMVLGWREVKPDGEASAEGRSA
ncbi:MAG: hypothetical protein LUC93_01445 [Planctomycetaceae bacterium]|nr:hypothetical protein [Planctomycetaceae bacterium]